MAVFYSKARSETFTGKEATFDTYYSNAVTPVTIDLAATIPTATGTDVGVDELFSIEAAHGGGS